MDIFSNRRHQLQELVDHYAQGNISVFAERFGYSRAQISQYLSETYNGGRSIGERAARALEKKLGVTDGHLDEPPFVARADAYVLGKSPSPRLSDQEPIRTAFMVTAAKDAPGFVDLVPRPEEDEGPLLQLPGASREAFALVVYGSGLRPRAKSGEFLIIDPSVQPVPGDDVFMKITPLASEHAPDLIMQFLYRRGDEITFGQLNENGQSMTVPAREVLQMHPIIAILGVRNWKTESNS